MILDTLRDKVRNAQVSAEDSTKLLAAIDRIQSLSFDCNHKLRISKPSFAKILSNFATMLNTAINEWQSVVDNVQSYQRKIDTVMSALNYRVINSKGISADMHRNILRIKATVREAYNKACDAIKIAKNAVVALANINVIDQMLSKCKITLK